MLLCDSSNKPMSTAEDAFRFVSQRVKESNAVRQRASVGGRWGDQVAADVTMGRKVGKAESEGQMQGRGIEADFSRPFLSGADMIFTGAAGILADLAVPQNKIYLI